MKKAFIIFLLSLNLLLTMSVMWLAHKGRAEKMEALREREALTIELKQEAALLLDRAERLYDMDDIQGACRSVGITQYVLFGIVDEDVTSVVGAAESFFAENDKEKVGELFFTFVSDIKKIINGELELLQSEAAFEISSSVADNTIEDNSQGILWERAAVQEETARKTASELLGANLLLRTCENSIFPERYIFAGGNTYASVTLVGGELREALFFSKEETTRISEQKAVSLMRNYLDGMGYTDLSLRFSFYIGGIYYARFSLPQKEDVYATIGVRGGSGSVCFFEVERLMVCGKNGT